MRVSKAVIPAAGLGTRFLPSTKAQPKEMLNVVDKPAIQYAVEEAVRAGIDDILIVTGRGKGAIEDHFDRSVELEGLLERKGSTEDLEDVRRIAEMATVHYVRQQEQRGLGHAVLQAERHVGSQAFAVLLPDEIIPAEGGLLERLVDAHERYGGSTVAVMEVPGDEIRHYGAVQPEPVGESLVQILDFVEKPEPAQAPSNLASFGRYILTPEVLQELHRTGPGAGGEIQLTDAIRSVAQRQPAYAYIFAGRRYDIGQKLGYLRATIELAAAREDLGPGFRELLRDLAARERLL